MNKNELFNCIQIYQFCAVDLNLFLDTHPDDKDAYEDYCRVSAKLDELYDEYEKKYGPLRSFGMAFSEDPNAYINCAWPWENVKRED